MHSPLNAKFNQSLLYEKESDARVSNKRPVSNKNQKQQRADARFDHRYGEAEDGICDIDRLFHRVITQGK